jgi:hypothetical protein
MLSEVYGFAVTVGGREGARMSVSLPLCLHQIKSFHLKIKNFLTLIANYLFKQNSVNMSDNIMFILDFG